MQGKAPISNSSLFYSIYNLVSPEGRVKPTIAGEKRTVYDIFFEPMTSSIEVRLDYFNQDDEEGEETIYLSHRKFLTWLEKNNMFTITTGGHYQQGGDIVSTEDDYQIGYAEFLTDHLTDAIIKDYLISEKIVPYAFDSAI